MPRLKVFSMSSGLYGPRIWIGERSNREYAKEKPADKSWLSLLQQYFEELPDNDFYTRKCFLCSDTQQSEALKMCSRFIITSFRSTLLQSIDLNCPHYEVREASFFAKAIYMNLTDPASRLNRLQLNDCVRIPLHILCNLKGFKRCTNAVDFKVWGELPGPSLLIIYLCLKEQLPFNMEPRISGNLEQRSSQRYLFAAAERYKSRDKWYIEYRVLFNPAEQEFLKKFGLSMA